MRSIYSFNKKCLCTTCQGLCSALGRWWWVETNIPYPHKVFSMHPPTKGRVYSYKLRCGLSMGHLVRETWILCAHLRRKREKGALFVGTVVSWKCPIQWWLRILSTQVMFLLPDLAHCWPRLSELLVLNERDPICLVISPVARREFSLCFPQMWGYIHCSI